MSVVLGAIILIVHDFHGDVDDDGPADRLSVRGQFMGVKGEAELRDQSHGRTLRIEALFYNYGTQALIELDLDILRNYVGQAATSKQLLLVSGKTYTYCSLDGVRKIDPIQLDAATSTYRCRVEMVFRKLREP